MDTSKTLNLVGRVLFSIPFLYFAYEHITKADQMAGMVPSWMPGATFWVYFTGIAMVAGAAAIVTGKMGMVGALGIAALMIVFDLTLWLPMMGKEGMADMATMSLMKDTMIAGGALGYASYFSKKG